MDWNIDFNRLRLNVSKYLRYWQVQVLNFRNDQNGPGELSLPDPTLYLGGIQGRTGNTWGLVPQLADIFSLLLHEHLLPFQILKRMENANYNKAAMSEFLNFFQFPFAVNAETFLKILAKVGEVTQGRAFSLVSSSKHHVPPRDGYLVPHCREMVLEIGTPDQLTGSLCGNNCRHCGWGNIRERFLYNFPNEIPEAHLLKESDYLSLVDFADRYNIYKLRLTGAPFHHWELTRELIAKAMELGLELELHCESTFLEDWQLDEIVWLASRWQAPLPIIHVSIEGATANSNAMIRQSIVLPPEKLFQKIQKNIQFISVREIPLIVATCAHAGNINEGEWWQMYEMLRQITGLNWLQWTIYMPENVGRLAQNHRLIATSEKIAQASLTFLEKWLQKIGDGLPEVVLPLCGSINPSGRKLPPEKLFLADGKPLDAPPASMTAFPKDRLSLYVDPYGGIKQYGMQFPDRRHYLWQNNMSLPAVWGLKSYQQPKNIPLMPKCMSCPIGRSCRSGFMPEAIGSPKWQFEKLCWPNPNEKICAMVGWPTMENLRKAHQLLLKK